MFSGRTGFVPTLTSSLGPGAGGPIVVEAFSVELDVR